MSKENTIRQIIKHIFYVCSQPFDSKIKVPPGIKLPYDDDEGTWQRFLLNLGYELRLVDEDEEVPIYDIPALETTRELGKYGIESVAFCAKKSYVAKSEKKISIIWNHKYH